MFKFICVNLMFFSTFSYSGIYKCDVDGIATFSQFPCGDEAKEITVKVYNKTSKQPSSTQDFSNNKNDVDKFLIRQEIKRRNKKINHYKFKLEKELEVLKKKAYSVRNNLAGSTYRNELNKERITITNKYNELINDEKIKIIELNDQ
ncbi:MAG: hypothetical protein JKX78_08090 [Alteromonadaceae bacterium]|nr:hypothetical protein [Alteromonadaceae bacterium]